MRVFLRALAILLVLTSCGVSEPVRRTADVATTTSAPTTTSTTIAGVTPTTMAETAEPVTTEATRVTETQATETTTAPTTTSPPQAASTTTTEPQPDWQVVGECMFYEPNAPGVGKNLGLWQMLGYGGEPNAQPNLWGDAAYAAYQRFPGSTAGCL